MPKRANPFSDDFIPQSKVHVSNFKQFNNSDDRLKKVYEKTLALLFKGAKKLPVPGASNNSSDIHFIKKEEKMKQLFIGTDGSLLHSGSMESNTSVKRCVCGGVVEWPCAYCEVGVCSSCEHHCTRCDQPYCLRCVLLGSEGSEVCVSCYG